MTYILRHLGVKLFLSYLVVILAGVAVLALTTQAVVPRAFERHMGGGMMGMGMPTGPMMGWGAQDSPMADLLAGFRAGVSEALGIATIAALIVAATISLFFSRGVVAPLRAMTAASRRIAAGHFEERVQGGSADEIGQLAESFNSMAARLEQVESMRRQLIADVSHELRTPLTAIQGSMEGLIDGVLPATAETFAQMHAEADRLNRLVDDLQELSRIEAGAYPLDLRSVDLPDIVGTVVKRLGPEFTARRIELSLGLPAEPLRVRADPDRVIQVLTNLVGNALQYTPAGGSVRIGAASAGGMVQISVTDTGIGIPAEHLPHVFDRFYRVDRSRSRQAGGGSGIGLTIARHLVEAHGGRIWAESDGPGKGSAFTFMLPVA